MVSDLTAAYDKPQFREDQTTEFKTSIFIDPETGRPGHRQMFTIAETLAAFMNADGGSIYVGVADNQVICGIENDLLVLKYQQDQVIVRSPRANDMTYVYDDSEDKYELKIRAIIKAYLSPNAHEYVKAIHIREVDGKKVCRIAVTPCRANDYVYVYQLYGHGKPEVAEIYVRSGNQKIKLLGEARDRFVKKHMTDEVKSMLEGIQVSNSVNGQTDYTNVMESIQRFMARLDEGPTVVGGETFVVEGAVALSDAHFDEISSPKGFIFDEVYVCDVKGWKGAYEALVKKLNEIAPAKFDQLAQMEFFSKFFIESVPRKRYSGYVAAKLGTQENIRAKEVSGKAYFTNPNYIVHRLLEHVGVAPSRVMFRA